MKRFGNLYRGCWPPCRRTLFQQQHAALSADFQCAVKPSIRRQGACIALSESVRVYSSSHIKDVSARWQFSICLRTARDKRPRALRVKLNLRFFCSNMQQGFKFRGFGLCNLLIKEPFSSHKGGGGERGFRSNLPYREFRVPTLRAG